MILIVVFLSVYFCGTTFAWMLTNLRLIELFENEGLNDHRAEGEALKMGGTLDGIQYFGAFFTGPIFGALSDRYGRKPFFAISIVTYALNTAAYISGSHFWLYVTKALLGLTDSFWTMGLIAVAEIAPSDKKAFGFALFWVSLGISYIGFPALAGLVSDWYGIVFSFKICILVLLLDLLLLCFIPEPNRFLSKEPVTLQTFNFFRQFALLGKSFRVFVFSCVTVALSLVIEAIGGVFQTFVIYSYPALSHFVLGTITGVSGIGMIISGPLAKYVVPRIGEEISICISELCGTIGVLGFCFTWEYWQLYPIILLRSINVVASPTIQALLFKEFPVEQQGAVVGALSSAKTIPYVVGPFIFPQLFDYFITEGNPHIPGIVFYVVGTINFCCFLFCSIYFWKTKRSFPLGQSTKMIDDKFGD